jgi:hypothetical protein
VASGTAIDSPALPCPECRQAGRGGKARIGNRRNRCTPCNNFAQNVMRLTRARLKAAHEQEYFSIRMAVELDLYPQVMEDWLEANPAVADELEMRGPTT